MAIREELELDITSALETIDSVGSALEAVASTFATAVSEALTELDSVSNITADATVTADTSEVESSVEDAVNAGAENADATVTVQGDTSTLVADIEGVEASPVEVTVTADTAAAQAAIEELNESAAAASGSGGGLGSLDGTLSDISSSSAGVAGSIGGITGGLASSIPVLAGASAAIIGIGGATDIFFNNAVEAEAATGRFQQTFGSFASDVDQVNVGSLNQDLSELAIALGSDDDELRQTASTFGQLGLAAGASAEEVAKSTQELLGLSARAVALNPQLGSVSDVAASMQTALARGGRFAAKFGIDLSSAEINARALADSGKANVAELSQFEKSAAGAALAAEKYGDSIQSAVSEGSENGIVRLRRFSIAFADATETIGAPVVAPIFELLETAQPVLVSFAEVIGSIAGAVIPVIGTLLSALQPVVEMLAGRLTSIIATLAPGLADLGQSVAEALSPIATVLGAVVPVIEPFASGLSFVATGVANLLSALGPLPGLLLVAYAAFQLFTLAMQTNPLILIATAILGVIGVVRNLNKETKQATVDQESFRSQLYGTAESADELRTKIDELDRASADYLATQSEIAKAGQTDALLKIGEDADTVTKQLNTGAKGFNEFVEAGIRAGQISVRIDGAGQSGDDIDALNESLSGLIANGRAQITQNGELVTAFNNETFAREQASQAQLNQLVITGQITEAQKEEAISRSIAELGIGSYTQALGFALEAQKATTEAQLLADPPLSQSAASWTALAQSVANGTLNMGNAQLAADATGVSLETMQGFIRDTGTAIDLFVANSVAKLPSVQTEFQKLTAESDPTTLAANLDAATLSILTFSLNLDTIAAGGFTEVAKFLQEQGPEAAGAFAASFTNMTEEQKNALNTSITNNNNARKAYGDDLKNDIANSAEASKVFAENSTKGFAEGLDYSGVTDTEVKAAQELLKGENLDLFKADANQAGVDIGAALMLGLASGLGANSGLVEQAARDAIIKAEEAARNEAESNSPSKLFARIGADLGAGVAVGLNDASSEVVRAAEQIVRDAARGASGQPFEVSPVIAPLAVATPVTAPLAASGTLGGSTTTIDVGGLNVKVITNSPSEARAIGVALATGFADQLEAEGRIG